MHEQIIVILRDGSESIETSSQSIDRNNPGTHKAKDGNLYYLNSFYTGGLSGEARVAYWFATETEGENPTIRIDRAIRKLNPKPAY